LAILRKAGAGPSPWHSDPEALVEETISGTAGWIEVYLAENVPAGGFIREELYISQEWL